MVEIGNSYLVRRFVDHFGTLPSIGRNNPALPNLPDALVPDFAAGWLAARGNESAYSISWSGPKPALAALSLQIQQQVDVGVPEWEFRTHHGSIAWAKPDEIENLQHWLAIRRHSNVADPPLTAVVA
jgi:hypothetical protein